MYLFSGAHHWGQAWLIENIQHHKKVIHIVSKSIISQSSVHCSKIILLTHWGPEWNIVWKGCFDQTICHGKSHISARRAPTDRVVTTCCGKANAECDVKDASNHQLQIVPREGLLRIRCALKWYSLRTAGQVIPKRVLYLGSFSSLTYCCCLKKRAP